MYSSKFIFNIPGVHEIIMSYKKDLEVVHVRGSTGRRYEISYNCEKKSYHCTCPAFKYYPGECKHIKKLRIKQN